MLLFPLILISIASIDSKPQSQPLEQSANKLLVVSFDAFKPAYMELRRTPHLQACIKDGVHSAFMRPTFPTKTFPNHFSLATGLHAGVHGVLSSSVYDRKLNATLQYGRQMFHERDWITPIWVGLIFDVF